MLTTKEQLISQDGTVKFLFALADGNLIETVLMRHPYGNSVCVTSQAGCNMGCIFCASGLLKKVRDLTAEEMLEQVLQVQRYLNHLPERQASNIGAEQDDLCLTAELQEESNTADKNLQVTHVVVMGTGEPFDNYDEVLRFCDMVSDEKQLFAVAPRHITVSTCGLVPEIYAFAKTNKRYNLAISLHAPNDTLRNRLMPINRRYPLAEVIKAAKAYCKETRRRVTLEYLLLEGMNDSLACAKELAELLMETKQGSTECGQDCRNPDSAGSKQQGKSSFYVNLIPWNKVAESPLQGTGKETALAFYDVLMKHGIKATLRKERGTDIAAACGQLRARYAKKV